MAEPLKIVRRLNEVTTDYAVFERDQVLTERQLNSVTEYLDDQGRLTRTQLLGVGIVGGLWPSLAKDRLHIGAGVGVTSDGDLLGFAADTVFDRWLPYDETAPAYEPFYVEGRMLPLIELLAEGDRRDGKPLAELANELRGKLAIAFMESYENDPDLCTGGDCDNKGRTARNTQRLLLVDRDIGQKSGLAVSLPTGADLAASLPRLRAGRADLGTGNDARVDVTSAERFAARYRSQAEAIFKALSAAVERLTKQLERHAIGGLPSPATWAGELKKRLDALPGTVAGIQYFHAHAKDLVAVWGDLRAALFADDSVLAPAAEAFPKHLLLGALAEPTALRTGCYPAPWLSGGTAERRRVVDAMQLFGALLAAFSLPAGQVIKITPSRRETAALGERAVPAYYAADATLRQRWNPGRAARGETDDTLGYHWTPTPAQGDPNDPFASDQGGVDFYRIEGFLGQKADAAEVALEKLVRQRNLPIAVMSALTHNERRLVVRGPKFKRTGLHSLHYLLRQDLVSHLNDNIAYSSTLAGSVKTAQQGWVADENRKLKVGMPVVQYAALTKDYTVSLGSAKAALERGRDQLVGTTGSGPLAARSYKAFQAQQTSVAPAIGSLIVGSAKAKIEIGDLARNDVISPLDAFAGTKTHLWVDWLGDILKKREDDDKDRLLLTNMLFEHPGLEHAGGTVPGGTFVLVYNDAGDVIGDLMLPYWLDDNDESDLVEPVLKQPDIELRLPLDVPPISFIKPRDLAFDDFKVMSVLPEIKIQENYSSFFQKSLGSLGEVIKTTRTATVAEVAGSKAATNDSYMAQMLAIIQGQQAQIKGLRDVAGDDRLPAETRDKAQAQIKQMEEQLADSVGTTVEYFAVAAPETVRFEADKAAVYETVGLAVNQVTDREVSNRLKDNLKQTATNAGNVQGGSSALVANQLMNKVGIG